MAPMGRSVVLNQTPRCARCFQPGAWCLCAVEDRVTLPFAVDVLMHHAEMLRPTSTGHLIQRLVPDARLQVFRPEGPPDFASVRRPGGTVWILHPLGDDRLPGPPPDNLQVILVDGSWRQASAMLRAIGAWGEKVRLPMSGTSRYWLRSQQGAGQFSTMEALLFLLESFGRKTEALRLRTHFELQVYAGLSVRGDKTRMAAYLESSSVRDEVKTCLDRRLATLGPLPARIPEAPTR